MCSDARLYRLEAFDDDKGGVRCFVTRAYTAADAELQFNLWRRRFTDAAGKPLVRDATRIEPAEALGNPYDTVF